MRTVTETGAASRYLKDMQARETNLKELSRAYSQYLSQSNQIAIQQLESTLQVSTVIALHSKRNR